MRATDTTHHTPLENSKREEQRREKTRRMGRNAARKKSRESNDINKTINKIHFVKIDFFIICTLRFSVACSTDDCATHSLVSRVFSKSSPVFWSSFKIGFFFPSSLPHFTEWVEYENLFIIFNRPWISLRESIVKHIFFLFPISRVILRYP